MTCGFELAPSAAGQSKRALSAKTQAEWKAFVKRHRAEMSQPDQGPLTQAIGRLVSRHALIGRGATAKTSPGAIGRCCGAAEEQRR